MILVINQLYIITECGGAIEESKYSYCGAKVNNKI